MCHRVVKTKTLPCTNLNEHVASGPDCGAVDDLPAALLHDHVEEGGAQVDADVAVPDDKVPAKGYR